MKEQYTIFADDKLKFSFPTEIAVEDLRLTCEVSLVQKENTGAVFIKGKQEAKAPLFGLQNYLDAREGISFAAEITGADKMTAVYQHKDWWIRPAFPEKFAEIPERTQMLLLKGEQNYLVLVAVCGKEYRTDLSGADNEIRIKIASNCAGKNVIDDISFVFAYGEDPYQCCEDAVSYALELLGKPEMQRKKRVFPEMFEKFGWCSWDAFYHKVSEQGLFEKLAELNEKQIPVKWALIDDGWLDADYDKQVLKGLDAAKDKFPEGLGSCVSRMKNEFGMEQVGVWHAVMGYWNGLEAGSKAQEELAEGSENWPDGRISPKAEAGKAFRFYEIWHKYLKNTCGIDFVKVDGQSAISLFNAGKREYGKASEAVQTGLNASAALYFNNAIINCMGMASEDMWNRPSSAISRSSDDFVPDVPHGFREHAIQNGYNSLLQGQFFWGDWDMFWSDHEENWQNAVLRAVSGGPVYTSDKVGRTDPTYIRPLIKKDGTVIRCEDVGVPTTDCLFEDPVKKGGIFKLFNRYQNGYVIAAFNIGEEEKTAESSIRIADIPQLSGKEWYVYAHKSKKAAYLKDNGSVNFALDSNDAEIFLLLPVSSFCPAGILEKFIPSGCVSVVYEREEQVGIKVSEPGTFGFFMAHSPKAIYVNGKVAKWEEENIKGAVFVRVPCEEDSFLEMID